MSDSTIATAADYADAMITARKARNWLFWVLFIVLLGQLAIFFVARYSPDLLTKSSDSSAPAAAQVDVPAVAGDGEVPATQSIEITLPAPAPVVDVPVASGQSSALADWLHYFANGTALVGILSVAILAIVLLLIIQIMLIGRLIGVSQVTSAFIWTIVLGVLLFPWQAYLNFPGLGDTSFRLPGVLFTWSEVISQARFSADQLDVAVLKWARFVGFPVVALIILIIVQVKSRRGLKLALGETEPIVIETGVDRA